MSPTFVTEEEIRQTLLENLSEGETSKRELMRSIIPNRAESDTTGSILYALSGSPPRGYAIYTPEMRRLNFYAPGGKRIDHSDDIDGIAEIDATIQRVVSQLQEQETMYVDELTGEIEEEPVIRGPEKYDDLGDFDGVERALEALKSRGVIVENRSDDADSEEDLVQFAF